jgi:regulatory protein
VKEVRDNLKKKKAPGEIIEKIIATLIEQKFLNDRTFAQWWVEQRLRFNPKSLRVIKLELRQKGIDPEIIEAVTQNPLTITDEALPSERETAKKLVEKKIGKYKDLPRVEMYQKLGAFLARRGYDWETIKRAIDETLK